MFRSLRIKLTLFNLVVVSLIFVFIFSAVYMLMSRNVAMQTEQLMQLVAADAGLTPDRRIPLPPKHLFNYFYVKVSFSGAVIDTSPQLPVADDQLRATVGEILVVPQRRGVVDFNGGTEYRFLKLPLSNGQGTALIFASTELERSILERLLTTLTLTGVVCLSLALFGSFFMANRALIPVKKSWEQQKNFVADASHELRTPLAVIQTNLELVMGNSEETVKSQAKWLENIQAETRRMAKLVDDLLFLARADSGEGRLEMKHFLLDLALQEAFTPFEPIAAQKGITMEAALDQQVSFYGDENRIKQLIIILVDNALKYTNAGGRVRLELKDLGNNAEISVADTGEGIAQEHLEKIFERFYRVDKARAKQSGGTGLGLSIAEWIVKKHRGTIKVASTRGKGTTFRVMLPKRS